MIKENNTVYTHTHVCFFLLQVHLIYKGLNKKECFIIVEREKRIKRVNVFSISFLFADWSSCPTLLFFSACINSKRSEISLFVEERKK